MMNSLMNKTAKQLIRPRQFSSAAAAAASSASSSSGSNSDSDNDNNYVSPFKEFFDLIERGDAATALQPTFPPEREEELLRCGIPESCLRFRTIHYGRRYLSPFVEPWEHRVTLKVGLEDLPIDTDLEKAILQEIVGNRMNETQLQLSSNLFGSRLENKRHLVSMLDRIVLGVKRLANDKKQEE